MHNFTPHWQFLRSNVIPKNYDSYVPDCYSDMLPLTKENIKDIFKKEATTKNIYRIIVDKHTKKYEIASDMKWNRIRQEIVPWKWMWENTFNCYNIPQENNIISKYYIEFYMLIKRYTTTRTTKTTSPLSATIAKPRENPYCTHSTSARTNTTYGNISFK